LGTLVDLGVISNDSVVKNSGEVVRGGVGDREGLERDWEL
jgi:hypothetical protein